MYTVVERKIEQISLIITGLRRLKILEASFEARKQCCNCI